MSDDLLQKLIDAKLAGHRLFDADGDAYYQFRTNEQAAKIAEQVAREHYAGTPPNARPTPSSEPSPNAARPSVDTTEGDAS